jgi:hypothetical protein
MKESPYDPNALAARALAWRAEADASPVPAIREYCLHEAEKCELRVRRSIYTPAILEAA